MGIKKSSNREAAISAIRKTADKWTAGYVPRSKVSEFTGGLIASGTMANLDCKGEGVPGGFLIGRQKCYPVDNFVDWLIDRLEV